MDGRMHGFRIRRLGRICGCQSIGRAVPVPGKPNTKGTAHGKQSVCIPL